MSAASPIALFAGLNWPKMKSFYCTVSRLMRKLPVASDVVPVDAAAAVDGINVCRAADGKEVVVTATKHVGVVAGVVHDGLRAASASERGRCGSHREAVHRADVSEFVVVIAE
jgi:hypothetical protein